MQLTVPANLRDLGGYVGADGRRVRWGAVFRSAALHGLSSADAERVDALGIRTVYDLRVAGERVSAPISVPPPATTVHLPLGGGRVEPEEMLRQVAAGATPTHVLVGIYTGVLDESAASLGILLRGLIEKPLPALVHCAYGKDRTGVAAAMLLLALGVDRDQVVAEYALTAPAPAEQRTRRAEVLRLLEELALTPERLAGLSRAEPEVLAAALDHLDERYGGHHAYLTGPAGLREHEVEQLRAVLLV